MRARGRKRQVKKDLRRWFPGISYNATSRAGRRRLRVLVRRAQHGGPRLVVDGTYLARLPVGVVWAVLNEVDLPGVRR